MSERKRGYSRAFPYNRVTEKRYLLDHIPAAFWVSVRARAKREGISIRALILTLLSDWLDRTNERARFVATTPAEPPAA